MNPATVLFVFLCTVAPVCSLLHCSDCHNNCNESHWRFLRDSFTQTHFFIARDQILRLVAPWEYKTNFNNTRLPDTIHFASCSSRYCLNDALPGFNYRLQVLNITYNVRVYYKERCPNRSHFRLVPGTFNVIVGCTCIRLMAK